MARSRVLSQGTLASHWTLISLIALAMLLVALPYSRATPTRAQELEGASAGDNTEVIAQGVAPLAGGAMAWRLVEDTAEPIGEAAFEERALGFAIATDGALLLTDDPSGARTLLDQGEAAFTLEGANQMRETLDDTATSYLRIGLVEASEASNGNGDEVLFAGNGFDVPEGDHEVELVGVKLAAGESASVASEYEALVVVIDGEVTVGEGEVIAAGEATAVSGDVELRTEDAAARVFVAVIGADVPAAAEAPVEESTPVIEDEAGTGRIIVLTELCPAGVTAEQAADTSEGDPCFGGAAVEDMTVQVINTETEESFESDIDPANASAAFQGLPAGNYDVIFTTGEGLGETVGDCGGQDQSADLETVSISSDSVNLELPAEREYLCVTRTVQLDSEVSTEGLLSATFFACPEGMTFETLDPSQCEVITEGFDFGFQGDVDHPDLHLADATLGEGTFLWTGLELYPDADSGVSYSPIVYAFPSGYDAYGISTDGGDILLPQAGGYVLTEQHQSFNLAVYFFSS